MQSCLIAKLSHYIDLSNENVGLLAKLEKDEREFPAHTVIYAGSHNVEHLHVVMSGWLYHYTDMPDGRRQIVRIHHPGDVLGFHDIAYFESSTTLYSCTDVCLCPFPKSALDEIFVSSPRITALLFSIAVRDQVILVDMLKALGRMSARERIAFLILDLLTRLRITNTSMTDTFRLPLNQFEIGDVIGLTNVYVSKSMKSMQEDGLIAWHGDRLQVINEPALVKLCDFTERYQSMDTSWFPGA